MKRKSYTSGYKFFDDAIVEAARVIRPDQQQFIDMDSIEIEKYERETDSIVMFDGFNEDPDIDDDYACGINFRAIDDVKVLVILIDGMETPFVLQEGQIDALREYLNRKF
jgi:hypothetical protein